MISRFAIVSFVLTAAALTLHFVDAGLPLWVSPLVAMLGWFMGFGGVKKNTSMLDVLSSLAGAFTLGFTLDGIAKTFPLYFVAIFLVTMVFSLRPMFIQKLGYVKMVWIEPVLSFLAVSAYVYANLVAKTGWPGWVLPVPLLFFALYMTIAGMKDIAQFREAAKKEYGVQEGKPAPEFTLPDHEEKVVTLGQFRGRQLVLLLFVRGDWCPSCHIMLRTYSKHAEKFKSKNVLVMAIGPDPVGVNREMVKKLELEYRILADDKQEALQSYGIQHQGKVHGQDFEVGIPMPASILVDKGGVVRYVSRADRAGEFLNPLRIFQVLETLEA